ncbi:hypothetical protein [Pandoravirus japonicus]|uniref:Uncharacterized protein n=1 Tax=Pandoravirus japonicus TaxID=2823154 RepID=A0A811BTR4_9VIRU|nr:hypothetical protein [Pandoravirus japonicus]
MAGLAVAMVVGAATTTGSAGCAAGFVAASTAILLGPRAADLVSHRISAAVLLALGCAGWFWMSNGAAMGGPSLPGDLAVVPLCAVSAIAGYAVACTTLLGASVLWRSATPGASSCARFLALVAVVAIVCVLWSLQQ